MKAVSIDEAKQGNKKHYNWLDTLARQTVLSLFENISVGHLVLTENGESRTFGQPRDQAEIVAHIVVNQPWAYRRVLLAGSVGSGEAYMLRGWTSPDPLQVVRLMVRNQAMMNAMNRRWSQLKGLLCWLFHKINRNSLDGARNNISAHYDLSNEFFSLFLDPMRMYSAAVFDGPDCTLEQASINKLDQVCRSLNLCPDDHLLEIGTGWGGLAIYAAKHYGCKVTTTTISSRQYDYAKAWIEREGLSDRITLLQQDYRDLTGRYDKLVSIEMVEAVGHQYYSRFFEKCSDLLKPNGLMVMQAITIADQSYHAAKKSVDYIQRYIFPGGALPSLEIIGHHLRKDTNMQMVALTDITKDYAKTLAEWRKRFWANIDQVRQQGFDDVFERMWDYYLVYCEGGFQERVISTVQLLFAKPDARDFPRVIN